jgi:hypothetical protein
VNGLRPLSAEVEPAAGASALRDALGPALSLADEWAGGALALLVGGSHATGSAVWLQREGRALTLSDLDVYAIVPGRAARAAGEARARSDRPGLRARLLRWGLAAPLEVAFLEAADLERLPARPGTLDLAARALVVKGEPSWRERIPRWSAADVPPEEIRLLHENRAFELLLAWAGLAGPELARLQSRHAVLKCALDVARVRGLAAGEDPRDAERIRARAPAGLEGPVDAALAWRGGDTALREPDAAREEWRAVAAAWAAEWRASWGAGPDAVRRAARRARLRRRVRCAVQWPARSGAAPSLAARLAHALDGTPQHRVNAAAAALLLSAAGEPWAGGQPALPDATRATIGRLGLGVARGAGWPAAAARVARAWDQWVLDGQRTESA